jgi:hypothetical protein
VGRAARAALDAGTVRGAGWLERGNHLAGGAGAANPKDETGTWLAAGLANLIDKFSFSTRLMV